MIVLHHCHQTQSMRVQWLLNELGVDYTLRVRPFDRSLRDDEFRSISPAGRVPALELDGEVYFESGAILEILSERFPARGLGRPPGDIDRPDFLVWLHFAETLTHHVAALCQQYLGLSDGDGRSDATIRIERSRLGRCYGAIEARLSSPIENRDWLLTSGFSAADIAVAQAVYMGRHFVNLDTYPEVSRWYAEATDRDSFRGALPPDGAELLFHRDFYPVPA